jgi:hypothetical protein
MSDDNGQEQDQGWTPGRIRGLCDRLRLTQGELAGRVGVTGRQMRRLVRLTEPQARPSAPVAKLLDGLEREAEARDRRRGG